MSGKNLHYMIVINPAKNDQKHVAILTLNE